jgi:hypothetical protein
VKKTAIYLILSLLLTSCTPVRVVVDYDKSASFTTYNTFGFLKDGIDRAEINDLDKRRILRSIETVLNEKGFTKSETPDLLINFFTKEKQEINIHNTNFGGFNYGWGWGYGPFMGMQMNVSQMNVTNATQGTLYIDLIDANKKELVWQGIGKGSLATKVEQKDENIHAFVSSILGKYPPEAAAKP